MCSVLFLVLVSCDSAKSEIRYCNPDDENWEEGAIQIDTAGGFAISNGVRTPISFVELGDLV